MEILGFKPDELRRLLEMREEVAELIERHHSPAQIVAVLNLRRTARRMSRFQTMKPSNDP
jgi:hypothetical protein